jgi:hypothetical protein
LTVITGVATLGAASLVAVIVAVPTPVAVTVIVAPVDVLTELEALTVNTAGLLETQLTVRPLRVAPPASPGIPVSTCVSPTIIGVVGEESVTLTTGGGGALVTVITGVVAPIVSLVAVIVAVPTPAAVTVTVAPLEVLTELAALTVNTAVLLETQLTVRPLRALPPPSLGMAVKTCVAPTVIGVVGAESVTAATGTGLTEIELVPDRPSLVAVIVTGPPTLTAVTKPLASTLDTPGAPEVQAIARPESVFPPTSVRVAISC